jgi:hypothetical protein
VVCGIIYTVKIAQATCEKRPDLVGLLLITTEREVLATARETLLVSVNVLLAILRELSRWWNGTILNTRTM